MGCLWKQLGINQPSKGRVEKSNKFHWDLSHVHVWVELGGEAQLWNRVSLGTQALQVEVGGASLWEDGGIATHHM